MQVFHALFDAEHAMKPTEFESFKAHVAMLLRDLPRGMTADLTDVAVAYWNGTKVVGAYLRDNGRIDEDFDFDENAWGNWRDEFLTWFDAPRFSERADLKAAFVAGVIPVSLPGGLWPRAL
ncbi:hypothetical protein BTHE68_61860 (plasmid) [Burkholderia sp. THE68]|jgi:hypothetical protein|nr:hypothetical protein BTHE68_61860 [Burkholderia sp. THE68]BCQ27070.1 hypothetical protein NK8_52590 [Caballeronia sp. NK8]